MTQDSQDLAPSWLAQPLGGRPTCCLYDIHDIRPELQRAGSSGGGVEPAVNQHWTAKKNKQKGKPKLIMLIQQKQKPSVQCLGVVLWIHFAVQRFHEFHARIVCDHKTELNTDSTHHPNLISGPNWTPMLRVLGLFKLLGSPNLRTQELTKIYKLQRTPTCIWSNDEVITN